MRKQLAEFDYPEHGRGYTLPRVVLITEDYDNHFTGIDVVEYIKSGDVRSSYRSFTHTKIPSRSMRVISFPNLNKTKDFPYPRKKLLDKVSNSLKRSHKSPAW